MNVQIGKRTFFATTSLNQIADALRIPRDRIDEVWDWNADQTKQWLAQYPAEVLKSPIRERRFLHWNPPTPT